VFSRNRSLMLRFGLCFFLHRIFLLLLLFTVSLLSTGFLFALLVNCIDAISVPVGVSLQDVNAFFLSMQLVALLLHLRTIRPLNGCSQSSLGRQSSSLMWQDPQTNRYSKHDGKCRGHD
jgi:hypothetical protein